MLRLLTVLLTLMGSLSAGAQELTGIWRGGFYNEYELLFTGAKYRYEIQMYNVGKAVKGVTYSYQNTRFYAKASMIGVWSASTGSLTLKENKMEEMKIIGGGVGCLMTCYLTYRKEGNHEYLEGTYTSTNMKNDTLDCGNGVVRLERVQESDFNEEDFIKNPPTVKAGSKPGTKAAVKPGQGEFLIKKTTPVSKPASGTAKKPTTVTDKKTSPPVAAAKKPVKAPTNPVAKPTPALPDKKTVVTKNPEPTELTKQKPGGIKTEPKPKPEPTPSTTQKPAPVTTETKPKPEPVTLPTPAVLKNRTNEVVETIATSARQLEISFYDNGEIDGDTISVYANNKLLVSRKGLSTEPIKITVNLSEEESLQEVVMVAENLGTIPPNTALMIVQAGTQRYTVRLSSTEQKNAAVRFRYDPNALK